ncbi:hypothetical protein B0H15DRAFT_955797 [Mycena belliarum]|uniref:Uncharacterized protein n=1 Tax=Mycena belliarum TaxID=1033014 RepID=A0AAD6XFW5_9AGAR|nr:hypothetical protein B0H15DRAFT_955797 [Mycena belliae]
MARRTRQGAVFSPFEMLFGPEKLLAISTALPLRELYAFRNYLISTSNTLQFIPLYSCPRENVSNAFFACLLNQIVLRVLDTELQLPDLGAHAHTLNTRRVSSDDVTVTVACTPRIPHPSATSQILGRTKHTSSPMPSTTSASPESRILIGHAFARNENATSRMSARTSENLRRRVARGLGGVRAEAHEFVHLDFDDVWEEVLPESVRFSTTNRCSKSPLHVTRSEMAAGSRARR